MAYTSQEDLENALGVQLVRAVYDDDNDGAVDAGPMAACLAYADAECDSFLRGAYNATFPITDVPAALQFAALDFACAYTARRRPELAHTLGSDPFKQFYDAAAAKMKRYVTYEQRLPATVGATEPLATVTTATGLAATVEPVRVFDDMGDF